MNNNPIIEQETLGIHSKTQCYLLDMFSFIVQGILGIISLSCLMVKRYYERPQRPWIIWFCDIFKQICSALTVHFLNLFISIFVSDLADECIWYFLNMFLDTTIGVLVCYLLMKFAHFLAEFYDVEILKVEFYFDVIERNDGEKEYRLIPKIYLAQLIVWIIVILLQKIIQLILNSLFKVPFEIFGNFILAPFTFNPRFELVCVMILFPIFLNAVQFWLFDEILKIHPEHISEDLSKREPLLSDKYN